MTGIHDTFKSLYPSIAIAVIALILVKCFQFGRTYMSWCRAASKVIGPPVHPLWGTLHLFPTPDLYKDYMARLVQEAKPKLIRMWIGPYYPYFSVPHPETAKVILKSSEPKCKYIGGPYKILTAWLGEGLLISGGSRWRRNRQLLTPAFHFEILKPYMAVYNEVSDTFLNKLAEESKGGKHVEIYNYVCTATLDTMLQCAFSYQGQIQTLGNQHPYVNAVKELTDLVIIRCIKPFLYFDFIYKLCSAGRRFFQLCKYVHEFSSEIITTRKKTLLSDPDILKSKKRLDFLDILLSARDENGEGLSDQEVRDEADTFLFEGHDTTASAISWAIYALGKYPDIQQKVYEDVSRAMEDRKEFEWDDIQKCQYLTIFLKEVMRMYSPVPFIVRMLSKPCVVDGVEIPEGLAVEIPIYLIHHHPDVWPDHMEFKPQRFLSDETKEKDPYSFVPFSAGPRNCIGQNFALNEQRVIIARLVRRFTVSLDPDHQIKELPQLVMRAKDGIKIRLEPRHK